MENNEKNAINFNSDLLKSYLSETCKWARFLAILGYVGFAIMLIFSALSFFLPSVLFKEIQQPELPMWIFAVMYLIYAAIYFFPVNFLFHFAVKVKKGMDSNDSDVIAEGFKNLRNLFKFTGILSIIVFMLFALTTIIAIPLLIFAVI
jgi:hypothetical protein